MNAMIKAICKPVMALLVVLACLGPALSASLLPNGKQTFFDANGNPLVAGKVYFYIPNTTTPKDTWQDAGQNVLNTNPVILDAAGRAIIYGSGTYRQIVQDSNGNVIWDQPTSATLALNTSWSGTSTGSDNAQAITNANYTGADGELFYFIAGFSNTGATTLSVNGNSPIAVVRDTGSGPVSLVGGEIVTGNVIGVVYSSSSGKFHLVTPTPIQSFDGAFYLNGVISPTILSADQNDWTPTGGYPAANTVRVSSTNAIKITGLTGGAPGRVVILHNVGSYTITLTANSSDSASGNRFLTTAPIELISNDNVVLQYDSTSSGWRLFSQQIANPIAGGFKALTLTNGVTPNTQAVGTAGAATLESATGAAVRRLSLNCTASLLTSGAGGLDTGSATQGTWYSYWFIYNPATNADSCILSTSSTFSGVVLPSGYNFAMRAGWMRTASGSAQFLGSKQFGRRTQYAVGLAQTSAPIVMASGNVGVGSWVAVATGNFVPPTASEISVVLVNGSVTAAIAPNNSYTAGASTSYTGSGLSNAINVYSSMSLESSNIYWISNGAGATIWAAGWVDNL